MAHSQMGLNDLKAQFLEATKQIGEIRIYAPKKQTNKKEISEVMKLSFWLNRIHHKNNPKND